MTLQEIEASTHDLLDAAEVVDLVGYSVSEIRELASYAPEKLPFCTIVIPAGRVLVHRKDFLYYNNHGHPSESVREEARRRAAAEAAELIAREVKWIPR